MPIQFKIDPERLTLGDLVTLEDFKSATWRERREMLANNMVDEQGNFIDYAEARGIISRLPVAQLGAASEAFQEAVKALTEKQLPPKTGSV
jgi:hypothetical protein